MPALTALITRQLRGGCSIYKAPSVLNERKLGQRSKPSGAPFSMKVRSKCLKTKQNFPLRLNDIAKYCEIC